jgi:hypothetical protein
MGSGTFQREVAIGLIINLPVGSDAEHANVQEEWL